MSNQQLRDEAVTMFLAGLYPPAYAFGREAIHDCEIGGYGIAAVSTILMAPWVMHRDKRFYPDAERFDPGRWTKEFSKSLPPFAYLPFGGGPRRCIGNSFAMMEEILLLATIARKFKLRMVPDHPVEPYASITLRPKHGIRMTLSGR